ncbi:MAG: shikimate dehydrogenase [Gammaproteobacteria bacterium]|nr:shikimate dehydrogenase [Gammaproteobacteria bacterium]MCZ6854265.1 shikimate dehydrogenase [Gammaproteobacteria bacterium]
MDSYAVVGNPVEHSLSPRIHGLFAQQTGETLRYERRLVPLDGFIEAVEMISAGGARGFNVTVPFKTQAHDWVDELDEEARAAGAVNTVMLENGRSLGCNTDGIGLVQDLVRNHRLQLRDKRVLLLGAGGAVLGVVRRLLAENPTRLVIANRTASKALKLAARLAEEYADTGCEITGLGLGEVAGDYDLVINGTSAGLQGRGDLIETSVVRQAVCYDMVYGSNTPFTRWARQAGAVDALNGLGMLVEQAAAAFYLWRGVRPETDRVLAELTSEEPR